MCVFEADWKLPHNLSGFSAVRSSNKVIIAGGQSKDSLSGQLTTSNRVFEVSF